MAPRRARYLSHSEVVVDPALDVREWTLSETGRARVRRLVGSDVFAGTRRVVTSAERKALETAAPMAEAIGCDLEVRAAMHENDRSATGYLPPPELEATADAFFARPAESIRGWERAIDAQRRIVAEVEDVLEQQGQGRAVRRPWRRRHALPLPLSRRADRTESGSARRRRQPLHARHRCAAHPARLATTGDVRPAVTCGGAPKGPARRSHSGSSAAVSSTWVAGTSSGSG